jgi:hypothetical protein
MRVPARTGIHDMADLTIAIQAASSNCWLLPMRLDDACPQLLISLQRPLIYLFGLLDFTLFLLK